MSLAVHKHNRYVETHFRCRGIVTADHSVCAADFTKRLSLSLQGKVILKIGNHLLKLGVSVQHLFDFNRNETRKSSVTNRSPCSGQVLRNGMRFCILKRCNRPKTCSKHFTRRPARRQFLATVQPVSRTQANNAMTSRLLRYSDIKGTELPPANILIPLERQLIALQLCS